jgi:glycosyltransferase involved in cell wall biosynthesis
LWAGAVDDAHHARLYAAAVALVHVSLDDGFSYPVVEALSFGIPVVASDIPVHREVAGEAALYAPAGDVEAVAERMRGVLDATPAERDRQRAAARARLGVLAHRSDVAALVALQRRLSADPPPRA